MTQGWIREGKGEILLACGPELRAVRLGSLQPVWRWIARTEVEYVECGPNGAVVVRDGGEWVLLNPP